VPVPTVTVTPPPAPRTPPRQAPAGPAPQRERAAPAPAPPQPAAVPSTPAAAAPTQTQKFDQARDNIYAPVGTAPTTWSRQDIEALPQGSNTPFEKVLLQFPGVSQDSSNEGNFHVRNEHLESSLAYRINGILLPDSLGAFGQFLDPSFVGSLSLITGALPAQYGFRTVGVVDIKTGTFDNSGQIGFYGGSRQTGNYSIQYGGKTESTEYFVAGRFLQNILGISNPTADLNAIHDFTQQGRGFAYVSTIIDPTTRLSFIGGTSVAKFQIPNLPGMSPTFAAFGQTNFDSANIDENQFERYQFGVLALQKSVANVDLQLSYFTRSSSVHFTPDPVADLMFNGVATDVTRTSLLNGIQGDAAIRLDDSHTLRTGMFVSAEKTTVTNVSSLLPIDSVTGNQISDIPFSVTDSSSLLGWLAGVYVSDEWKITDRLTLNSGVRFDQMWQYVDANQISPRLSLTYRPFDSTTFHAGFARNFTPPNQVIAAPTNTALFTSCPAPLPPTCTTVQAPTAPGPYNLMVPERSSVYDIGVVQKVAPGLELGADAYLKVTRDQINQGQFGAALVLNGFQYESGQNTGVELKALYTNGDLRAYANLAWATQRGNNVVTNQFLLGADEFAYTRTNWVYADHSQWWTGSAGVSYLWYGTRFSADMIYGSGLRSGFANTDHVPPYAQVNAGMSHEFDVPGWAPVTLRFDVINVFDNAYILKNGTGIGVFANAWGPRRGYYFGISQKFGPGASAKKSAAAPWHGFAGDDKSPFFTKAPAAAMWTWSGLYLGGNLGVGIGRAKTDAFFTDPTGALLFADSASSRITGAVAGGQAGYNWQLGHWLLGVEADAQGTVQHARPTFICPGAICNPGGGGAPLSVDNQDHRLDWFTTLRGRFGTTVTPDAIVYATAGLAAGGMSHYGWINPDVDGNGNPIVDGSSANVLGRTVRLGWAAGAGVEARLIGNWTGKLEYLHLDFGNASVAAVNSNIAPPIGVDLRTRVTDDILRFGFNYKFDPFVAPGDTPINKAGIYKAGIFKAPRQVAWTWEGYYLGLNFGYSWGKSRTDAIFDDTLGGGGTFATGSSFDLNGIVGGAQTGYNWQFGNWLAGVEGDIQLTAQRGNPTFVCPDTACNPNGPEIAAFDQNQHLEWFSTLRGRIGATVTPDALVYMTAGAAVGGFKTAGNVAAFDANGGPATSAFSNISIKSGWTAGAGIEAHLGGNWTGKIEYLYLDFGSISASSNNQLNVTLLNTFNSRVTDNVVRLGLNYRFDRDMPIGAKY
jgi:opacity protein-like surface antigen